MAICKNCGLTVEDNEDICPFCDANILEQKNIKENFIITPDLNEQFKNKNITINFNIRNIINDVDAYSSDNDNLEIAEANIKDQYLQSDITSKNQERIFELIDYYNDKLNNFKNKDKKELETKSISQLQEYVTQFNNIVNLCNKYKKIIPDKNKKSIIKNTIKSYNKEIHYIKKYFILPLYESEDLLAGSRIAKNFIQLIGLLISYFVICNIDKVNDLVNIVIKYTEHAQTPVKHILRVVGVYNLISIPFSIWFTNIVFSLFIMYTIKNKNFQVDKDKSYEALLVYTLVGFFATQYNNQITILYTISFMIYILYLTFTNIRLKKKGLNWFITKIATIILCIVLNINLFLFLK